MAVRDIGPVAWRDQTSALERMSGAAWAAVLREEKSIFNEAIGAAEVQLRLPAFKKALSEEQDDSPWFQLMGCAQVWPWSHGSIKYRVKGHPTRQAQDIDCTADGNLLAVEDVGGGSHLDQLICRGANGRRLWSVQNVGEQVAAIGANSASQNERRTGERVYFLRPEKKLWYRQICSVRAADGGDFRVEYEEADHQYSLALVKTRDRGLFAIADNNGYSKLFCLGADGWRRIDEDAIWHIPCGYHQGQPVRIVLTQAGYYEFRTSKVGAEHSERFASTETRGAPGPRLDAAIGDPIFYDPVTTLLMTRSHGTVHGYIRNRHVFKYSAAKVEVDLWRLWSGGGLAVLVSAPYMATTLLKVVEQGPQITRTIRPGTVQRGTAWHEGRASSADGTEVTYGYAATTRQPRALLVIMYGAYGIPTNPGNVRKSWAPLLEAGWAVGYAFVRGSGDNGWAWAEAGRRTGRLRSIEDAEACVAALRARLRIPAARTAIYGRSAGGILIGSLANRNPNGQLFGMVYGEVPYLDVLQTATNPALPLTEMEYDEFGDPAHKLEDLAFWVKYSPVTNVPATGIPALKVLCRTGANDTQVYAYEPIKWIRALRGKTDRVHFSSNPKVLGIASGEGHFYGVEVAIQSRAEDTALLDSWSYMSGLKSQ
jgi:hypothetical protein